MQKNGKVSLDDLEKRIRRARGEAPDVDDAWDRILAAIDEARQLSLRSPADVAKAPRTHEEPASPPAEPELTWLAQNAAEAKRRHDAGESLEAIGQWLAESLPPGTMGDLASMAQVTAESLRTAGVLPASEGMQAPERAASPGREEG